MYIHARSFLAIFGLLSSGTLISVLLFMGGQQHSLIDYSLQTSFEKLAGEENAEMRVRRVTECNEKHYGFRAEQRGEYFVLYNFVPASRTFSCHETVTYTTQGDFTFLDNISTLVRKWMGPVSVALYAPGDDFEKTVESIAYLRNCETSLIREFVTFHVFFVTSHFPKLKYTVPIVDAYEDIYDCSNNPPYHSSALAKTYRRMHNLTYPINVARNIARQMATTHYVFASDIELYPSVNLISKFMKMIDEHPEYEKRRNPRVYVLPIFEMNLNVSVPENKTVLQKLIREKKAFLFHINLCAVCHAVPKYKEWLNASETEGLKVFTVGKRMHTNKIWEAFYIGTRLDPLFDERLSWEGQSNKMPQAYSLCLLNYDYMVLDNAFLVHKPGIKKSKEQNEKFKNLVARTNTLVHKVIKVELDALYGHREGCYL